MSDRRLRVVGKVLQLKPKIKKRFLGTAYDNDGLFDLCWEDLKRKNEKKNRQGDKLFPANV